MTAADITKIVLGVLVALGGGGAIVLGLSNYLGQILAKRYEEKIKAKFQNEINEYQTQLDIMKESAIRYSDTQFQFYSKLWASLYELKLLGDELWQQATPIRLENFSKQLTQTKNDIEKASLLIEDVHYEKLTQIIKFFLEYQVGKSSLIDFRRTAHFDDIRVNGMIMDNAIKKIEFENLIGLIKADLKKQIGGK